MIIFDNVCFSYKEQQIFKGLSFSAAFSERIAILGGSGEGKSTLLKLLTGLIRPDSGRIIIDGMDITDKAEDVIRDVRMLFSLVFQEGALFDSLSVKENVAFCLREYRKDMSEEDIDERVKELLRLVGVEYALNLMPDELSGGMHRRVAIARSLAVFKPKMFLYDEPTAGLDPVNADNICRLIIDLCRDDRGLIIVTHKVFDALRVANRFMFLKDGVSVFDGCREMLLNSDIPDIQMFISEMNAEGVRNV